MSVMRRESVLRGINIPAGCSWALCSRRRPMSSRWGSASAQRVSRQVGEQRSSSRQQAYHVGLEVILDVIGSRHIGRVATDVLLVLALVDLWVEQESQLRRGPARAPDGRAYPDVVDELREMALEISGVHRRAKEQQELTISAGKPSSAQLMLWNESEIPKLRMMYCTSVGVRPYYESASTAALTIGSLDTSRWLTCVLGFGATADASMFHAFLSSTIQVT